VAPPQTTYGELMEYLEIVPRIFKIARGLLDQELVISD
jgi:hypothetical protein